MYIFAVAFSAWTTLKLSGSIVLIDYLPFVIFAVINIALCGILKKYRSKE